jgi:hypothetical protein
MNTAKRARLAAIPLGKLNLRSQGGMREFRRRARRAAGDWGNAWHHQTARPVGKHRLKNTIGQRARWRWVPKQ